MYTVHFAKTNLSKLFQMTLVLMSPFLRWMISVMMIFRFRGRIDFFSRLCWVDEVCTVSDMVKCFCIVSPNLLLYCTISFRCFVVYV